MNNDITILIPTSPIPSHPATDILDETIANLRYYTGAKVIIMADGIHRSLRHRKEAYKKYLEVVKENIANSKYGNCEIRIFDKHTHQVGMTKEVLKDVATDLILFCEHDTSVIGDVPFDRICDMVRYSGVNHFRFNIFHKILDEHQYLMIDSEPVEIYGVRLVRTIQYSQRPHIAKTEWYKEILNAYFPEGYKGMVEDKIHGLIQDKYKELGYDTFGLAIYTPEGETQLRSYHSDGRGTDTKIIEA